ncbi:LysR family transcriptional regulator [Vibrio gallicus]|uniref:LysR family transcriptional regulator n=1 Tax=Vibrio gallicus TaxID=190897 RepID=UPI0021C42026|nr:LysR family transcriptional regulator [Vibrio gallicus]
MNTKELRYFVTLVECNNFTRASEMLFVTQPTISKALKALEENYGQSLVHRRGREIELTQSGEVVYHYAKSILASFSEMELKLADMQQLKAGHITIGIPPMVGHLHSELLQDFIGQYPNIDVSIVEGGGRRLEKSLIDGAIDVAISMLPTHKPQFEYQLLDDYPIYVVLPKHPQWEGEQPLRLSELQDIPFYLYTSEFTITQIIEQLCVKKGFKPKIGVKSSQWDFLAAMVKSGGGVSFMPKPICLKLNADDYCFRTLADDLNWKIALMWDKDRYLSKASEAFVELVRSRAKMSQ